MKQFTDDFEHQSKQCKSNCVKNGGPLKTFGLGNNKARVVSVKYVSIGKVHDELEQRGTK